MENKLNVIQVFLATKAFLSKIYFEYYFDDLGSFLGEFAINKSKKNWQQEPETWDPLVWEDWMTAAKFVLKLEAVDVEYTLISDLNAYLIMKTFVQNYAVKLGSNDLMLLSNSVLNIDQYLKHKQSFIWTDWLKCLNATINNKLTLDGCLVSVDTVITRQQAFKMMNVFLKKYLNSKNVHSDLIGLFTILYKNKNFYKDWSLEYFEYREQQNYGLDLTVIQAFSVMNKFLEKQKEMQQINIIILVDAEQKPIEYKVLYDWLQAAYVSVLK